MSEIFLKKSIEDFNLDEIKKDESLVFVDKNCNLSIVDGETKKIESLKTNVQEVFVSVNKYLSLKPIKYIISGSGNLFLSIDNWNTGDEAEVFVDTKSVVISNPSDWIICGNNFKKEEKQYVLKISKYENNIFVKIKFYVP